MVRIQSTSVIFLKKIYTAIIPILPSKLDLMDDAYTIFVFTPYTFTLSSNDCGGYLSFSPIGKSVSFDYFVIGSFIIFRGMWRAVWRVFLQSLGDVNLGVTFWRWWAYSERYQNSEGYQYHTKSIHYNSLLVPLIILSPGMSIVSK